jgi:hypothetical protein
MKMILGHEGMLRSCPLPSLIHLIKPMAACRVAHFLWEQLAHRRIQWAISSFIGWRPRDLKWRPWATTPQHPTPSGMGAGLGGVGRAAGQSRGMGLSWMGRQLWGMGQHCKKYAYSPMPYYNSILIHF